jgi:hypothetical protein
MVVNVVNQRLMPLTKDNKLTYHDLQVLSDQAASMAEPEASTINFLLNVYNKIATLGDNDVSSISAQDMQAFASKGIDLIA